MNSLGSHNTKMTSSKTLSEIKVDIILNCVSEDPTVSFEILSRHIKAEFLKKYAKLQVRERHLKHKITKYICIAALIGLQI